MDELKIVKCSNCNIVISEVLAYVQNKLDVMDEQSLTQICESAFSDKEIEVAKSLLFESLSKRPKTRRRRGKTLRNIEDIICMFKESDPEQVPIFVAKDLEKLPPISFDHIDVTALLKKIVLLEKSVKDIQLKYVKKVDLTEEVYKELAGTYPSLNKVTKNINMNRGARYELLHDSGPMALTSCNDLSLVYDANEPDVFGNTQRVVHNHTSTPILSEAGGYPNEKVPPLQQMGPSHFESLPRSTTGEVFTCGGDQQPFSLAQAGESHIAVAPKLCAETSTRVEAHTAVSNKTFSAKPTCAPLLTVPVSSDCVLNGNLNKNDALIIQRKSFAEIARKEGTWKSTPKDEHWTEVQRRRLRNKFIGNKGKANVDSDEKFKAADIQFYIYNVNKEATDKDIANYVMKKTNVLIIPVKMKMKYEKEYVAYKFFIPKHKLPVFMNADLWPDGVSFRQYVTYRKDGISKKDPREMKQ